MGDSGNKVLLRRMMKSFIILNILVSAYVGGQSTPPNRPTGDYEGYWGEGECCMWKMVGGRTYRLVERTDEAFDYLCTTDCVYMTEGSDVKFCFKPGGLESECFDEGGTWPSGSYPPMTGGPPGSNMTEGPMTGGPTGEPTGEPTGSATGSPGGGGRSYVAGVSYSFDLTNSPFCAGTLLSPSFVITSASCVYADNSVMGASKLNVVMGEEISTNMQVVGVRKIIVHSSESVALLMLNSALGDSYSKLCLAGQDTEVTGAVELVGWRISPLVGSLTQSLVSVTTQVLPQSDCNAGNDLICTSDTTRCQGDIGAPLVRAGNTLVGAVAGGAGCSRQSNNGIFVKLPKYTTWTQATISSESSESICIS